jgi:hypothetical protein
MDANNGKSTKPPASLEAQRHGERQEKRLLLVGKADRPAMQEKDEEYRISKCPVNLKKLMIAGRQKICNFSPSTLIPSPSPSQGEG